MAIREVKTLIGGIEHTVQVNDADKSGLTFKPVEGGTTQSKSRTPSNKSRTTRTKKTEPAAAPAAPAADEK